MFEPHPASHSVRNFGAPVLGVCGFSRSGKTTLLEAAIPHLVAHRLAVAVVKHDAHGFSVDRPGKDSDRFFCAGATVALRGPSEQFQRRGPSASLALETTLADLARDHDLILVEGHKDTRLPKLWLSDEKDSLPPPEVSEVLKVLSWGSERLETFLGFLERAVLERGPESVRIAALFEHGHTVVVSHSTRGLFNTNTPAEFAIASTMKNAENPVPALASEGNI